MATLIGVQSYRLSSAECTVDKLHLGYDIRFFVFRSIQQISVNLGEQVSA